MNAQLMVNKQSVLDLLKTGAKNLFVIPEYQRPYAWTEEQIDTLFNDIKEFTEGEIRYELEHDGEVDLNSSYFLGCIVSFQNDNKQQEIIDGQQRITSLFLLLRAIYAKIESYEIKTDVLINAMTSIGPAIWQCDPYDTTKVKKNKILLRSEVTNNDGNEILRNILETGVADVNATDNYSKNYLLFQKHFEKYAIEAPDSIHKFVYNLLNKAILMPIQTDSQETALTIFSTLNNRGLPLSDADIFKAKMYGNEDSEGKKAFIQTWKELDADSEYVGESIQQLFYYYMFYLRAKEKDSQSTTPGARKYYSQDKFKRLKDAELLDNLAKIANLWLVINKHENITVVDADGSEVVSELWSQNEDIRDALDCLSSYPNEFWKYPVVIYYLQHKDKTDFETSFLKFLRILLAKIAKKYIVTPTINAVKTEILKLDVEIINTSVPVINFEEKYTSDELKDRMVIPNKNIVRLLLKILAYDKQKELLPAVWEIEHILPQKWQAEYTFDASDEAVESVIEHIGNKIPFEKRLNIKASNDYFSKKKELYKNSKIEIVKAMGNKTATKWNISEIIKRDGEIQTRLMEIFTEWEKDYSAYKEQIEHPVCVEQNVINEAVARRDFLKANDLEDELIVKDICKKFNMQEDYVLNHIMTV